MKLKFFEIENETPFVKYTTLENNHLYGIIGSISGHAGHWALKHLNVGGKTREEML